MRPSLLLLLRQEIEHFLSVTSCDTLPLTRLEGLKELSRQLRQSKAAVRELLKECHGRRKIKEKYCIQMSSLIEIDHNFSLTVSADILLWRSICNIYLFRRKMQNNASIQQPILGET